MNHIITQIRTATIATPKSVWTWLGLAAFTALSAGPLLLKPASPDVSTFDYVGWRAVEGDALYVDVIEQNWPGAMWLHTLSSLLFGNHLWSFRIIDLALLLLGCAALFQLASVGGRPATRYLVVLLYQLIYVSSNLWMTGQRDMLATHVMLAIALLALTRMRGGPVGLSVVVGAAMALVSLTRPTCLLFFPLIYGVDALTRGERRTLTHVARDVVIAGLAFTGVLGAIGAVGAHSGALAGWYTAAVLFNAMIYRQAAGLSDFVGAIDWFVLHYRWLVGFALVGLACWVRGGERRVLLLLLCLVMTGVVSTYVQGKGFGYHLAPAYPALTLFAAEAVGAAVAYAKGRSTRIAWGLAVCGYTVVLLGAAKKFYNEHGDALRFLNGRIDHDELRAQQDFGLGLSVADAQRAADYARVHTTPDQTVLPWNRAVVINYLAARRLPTPIATVGMLDLVRASFPSGQLWLRSFEKTLRDDPPALIFAYNERLPSEHERLWNAGDSLPATAMVRRALATRYKQVARFGTLDAYALK